MTNKDKIQELQELDSTLAGLPSQNIYAVPEGYFEGFAAQVISHIKSLENDDSKSESAILSPFFEQISKIPPYSVPAGYFDGLEEKLMTAIRHHEDYQTADEELSSLSPLLSGIGKQNPYTVPQGYFENFENNINLKPAGSTAKTVSMVNRKWFRYAAAAIVAGIITITGIQFLNNNSGSISNPTAWVEKNMNKVSTDDINNFMKITDEGLSEQNNLATSPKTEIKDLMEDVSDKDIQDFLNKTLAGNDEADADILVN